MYLCSAGRNWPVTDEDWTVTSSFKMCHNESLIKILLLMGMETSVATEAVKKKKKNFFQ